MDLLCASHAAAAATRLRWFRQPVHLFGSELHLAVAIDADRQLRQAAEDGGANKVIAAGHAFPVALIGRAAGRNAQPGGLASCRGDRGQGRVLGVDETARCGCARHVLNTRLQNQRLNDCRPTVLLC